MNSLVPSQLSSLLPLLSSPSFVLCTAANMVSDQPRCSAPPHPASSLPARPATGQPDDTPAPWVRALPTPGRRARNGERFGRFSGRTGDIVILLVRTGDGFFKLCHPEATMVNEHVHVVATIMSALPMVSTGLAPLIHQAKHKNGMLG